jgi:predicted ATPase/DNA-binding SARP family transcriptional activator
MAEPTLLPSALDIRLFGSAALTRNGQPLDPVLPKKGLWLLALLVLRQERRVERDWLAGLLWPESTQSQALDYLRHTLTLVRKALGQEAPRLQSPTLSTLCLDLREVFVDVMAFDAAVRRGDVASLEQAAALYDGALLEGCPEEWILPEREAREQAYLQARETLARHYLEYQDFSVAIGHLRLVVTIDPLRESAQRSLMQALASDGEYAAALQVYRDLRLLLQRELRTDPDPQTQSLFQQLREEARRRAQPRPVLACAPSVSPHRLPRPLTSLVGRQQEIQELSTRLLTSRLVTLTGTGGVGKTRLAIAVAEALFEEFTEGVFFIDLSALSDPALVPQAVTSVLQLREQSDRSLLQTLTDYLEPKEMLLVLDNCEHLLAGCAPLAQGLLSGCPRLRVLATSRQALGLTGEMAWPVPALSFPQGAGLASPEKMEWSLLLEYEAVQLFVERGQQALPSFGLSGKNAAVVAQICAHLDGIPLAIELAAARVRALSVEQIASRLEDRFRLLTGGSRAVLPRQQTLRALLDWSYELLREPERLLLGRLSVFAGGWTLEAAESVCSGEDIEDWEVVDLLTSLVDKSLVVFEEREGGEGRYRLLETIRHYAQERLTETGGEPELQRRHLKFFLILAEEAESYLQGAEQGVWLNRLETEHENLRSALGACQAMGEASAEASLRLCGALARFWWTRGHLSEGRVWVAGALSQTGAEERTPWRANALNNLGYTAQSQGDFAAARAYQEESLAIYREIGDRKGSAAALTGLGLMVAIQGDCVSARACHEQSLAIYREIGDRHGIADSLNNLGAMARDQGDYASALASYEESLAISRETGDRRSVAYALIGVGVMAYYQSDYTSAHAFIEESLVIWREIGDRRGIALSLHILGYVAEKQGDYATARDYQEQSLVICREIGDRHGIAASFHNLGNVAEKQGDYATARDYQERSLALCREIGNRLSIAYGLEGFAVLASTQEQPEQAARLWGAAEALREEIGVPLPPNEHEEYDRQVSQVRAALGAKAFAAAWMEGRAMSWEQAAEYALEASRS